MVTCERSLGNVLVSLPLPALIAVLLVTVLTSSAIAQDGGADGSYGEEAQTITLNWMSGPGTFDLGVDLAEIAIQSDYLMLDGDDTRILMEHFGNMVTGTEVGTIAPASEEESWIVVFEFDDVGYVSDEEKDDIDADALLASIRESNSAANEYREERGITPLLIEGWETPPYYDEITHNLVWAIRANSEGDPVINRNTKILGREGVMTVTVIAGPEELSTVVQEIDPMMASFAFKPGAQYAEYTEGDKLAKYGLTALIAGGAGVAAAKMGLLAVVAKFFAKAWKLILLGVAAVGSFVARIFKKKSEPSTTA